MWNPFRNLKQQLLKYWNRTFVVFKQDFSRVHVYQLRKSKWTPKIQSSSLQPPSYRNPLRFISNYNIQFNCNIPPLPPRPQTLFQFGQKQRNRGHTHKQYMFDWQSKQFFFADTDFFWQFIKKYLKNQILKCFSLRVH